MTITAPTLAEYRKLVKRNECTWDDHKLPEQVDAYPHPDGWRVAGMDEKQWLSIKCPKCGYEWSLNKLGVPRGMVPAPAQGPASEVKR